MFHGVVDTLARVLEGPNFREVVGIDDDVVALSVALEGALSSGVITSADPLALERIRRVVSELNSF